MKLENGHVNLFALNGNKMLALYTTEQIVSSIFTDNENKYDAWYDFITKLRPNMKILLAEDTDYDDNEFNPVYMFQKDYDIDVEPQYTEDVGENSDLAKIESMQLASISDPCAVIILDVDANTAKKISEKYGVICHSFSESPLLSPLFQEGIEKNIQNNEKNRGWNEIFLSGNVSPSNSLVFVDRYLFSKDSNGITSQDGIDNVFEILNHILPTSLDVDYHVMLVFDATTLETALGDTFANISTSINRLKRRLNRPYQIIIETLSIDHNDMNYDETHNRRVLSNYFLVRAEHSLKAFRADKSLYSQSLWFDWAASKGIIYQKHSDAPAKALFNYLREVRRAINQIKKSKGTVPFTQNGNSHIDITSIKNRLMN